MKLTIGHLYPDLLNLYGDRGNIRCFQKRLQWRGIEAEVRSFPSDSAIDFTKLDLVLLGGGSDRDQALACGFLSKQKEAFRDYVEHGGVTLAICGGYQLLGNYYQTEHGILHGLEILDIYTLRRPPQRNMHYDVPQRDMHYGVPQRDMHYDIPERDTKCEPARLVGNIILSSPLISPSSPLVVGFENHGGRTYIGNHTPFGQVIAGYGNWEGSGYEGVIYKHVIATYLHGPLLPKNPAICDYLLEQALKQKYGASQTLGTLPDRLEHLANSHIVRRFAPGKFISIPFCTPQKRASQRFPKSTPALTAIP